MKLILVVPPCGFCFDRDAVEEVETVWGAWASLCPICADKIAKPGTGRRLVTASAQPPLPTREEAGAYVEAQTWTFARTMPKWPHGYVLIWRSTSPWSSSGCSRSSGPPGSAASGDATSTTTGRRGITSIGRCRPGRRS